MTSQMTDVLWALCEIKLLPTYISTSIMSICFHYLFGTYKHSVIVT